MPKENCWEFKKCGREEGGVNAKELGICPAAQSGKGDGVNTGKYRGRICWAITGTFCQGEVQGTFAQKEICCMDCPFFSVVEDEEGVDFKLLLDDQIYIPRHK